MDQRHVTVHGKNRSWGDGSGRWKVHGHKIYTVHQMTRRNGKGKDCVKTEQKLKICTHVNLKLKNVVLMQTKCAKG